MDIGLALPHYGYSFGLPARFDIDAMLSCAADADRMGFDSLWISEHFTLDLAKYGGPSTAFETVELVATLGALARVTSRARIGSLVALEAIRPAALLAKSIATIDQLSMGRCVLGLGAGWYEPDYTDIGMSMPSPGERVTRLGEALSVIDALFVSVPGVSVTAGGQFHSVHGAVLTPRPFNERKIPVIVGGKGDRVIDHSVRHADGWNTCWVWTLDAYRERLAVHDQACERHGVDPAGQHRSVGLYALVGENERDLKARFERLRSSIPGVLDGVTLEEWRVGRLVGTVDEVREQIGAWSDLGVHEIILGLGSVPFHFAHTDDLEITQSLL